MTSSVGTQPSQRVFSNEILTDKARSLNKLKGRSLANSINKFNLLTAKNLYTFNQKELSRINEFNAAMCPVFKQRMLLTRRKC